MKLIKIFIITAILLSNLAFALDAGITVKQEFKENELIYFNFTILSGINDSIEYIPYVSCPNFGIPLINTYHADVTGNIAYYENYTFAEVREDTEPQECIASLKIKKYNFTKEVPFKINTKPGFGFEVLFCKDTGCSEESKVFALGQDINIYYTSDIPDPKVEAALIYPDKTTQQFSIPASIKANQTGTYDVSVTASEEGHKTIVKEYQLGVIEKEASIPFEEIVKAEKPKMESNIILLLIGALIILGIVILVIIRLKKRKA